MNALRARWEEVGKLLREGRNCLAPERESDHTSPVPVGPLIGTLDEFEEFFEHNELELAWDALEAVAERLNAPPKCWHLLAKAATLMDLPSKAEAAERRAAVPIPSDRALAIARLDAETAYRDNLSDYRITITLEHDGWHIDYDLKDPAQHHGGGPHYIVDPMTGQVLSKRYEQ